MGKLLASHRCDRLPLLPSGPGGFSRSWSYKTYPRHKNTAIFGLPQPRPAIFDFCVPLGSQNNATAYGKKQDHPPQKLRKGQAQEALGPRHRSDRGAGRHPAGDRRRFRLETIRLPFRHRYRQGRNSPGAYGHDFRRAGPDAGRQRLCEKSPQVEILCTVERIGQRESGELHAAERHVVPRGADRLFLWPPNSGAADIQQHPHDEPAGGGGVEIHRGGFGGDPADADRSDGHRRGGILAGDVPLALHSEHLRGLLDNNPARVRGADAEGA